MLAATAGLVLLFFFINFVARRLPVRPLFIATSAFLFVMALRFIGEAIQEFQEQLLIPYNPVGGASWLSTLGLNPTWEALAAQAAVIVLAVATFVIWRRGATPNAAAGSRS